MTESIGTAKVERGLAGTIVPRVDGPVLQETMLALQVGGMKLDALGKVEEQAVRILGAVLGNYEHHVAPGEVGPTGTGRASKAKPVKSCPTGLLYGRVQSGKTLAMILSTALALDNGFKVVVVLTSDNVSLVEQTAKRFAVIPGVNVRDSSQIGSWVDDQDHLRTAIAESGLVLITAKNSSHLSTFIDFLQKVDADRYPALILDDEADQASLDNSVAAKARAAKKPTGKTPPEAGAIHKKLVENVGKNDEGSIRSTLRHHLYLQVTATPYALLLQNTNSPLRPVFTELLEPGDGYTGSDFFFDSSLVGLETAKEPLVYVGSTEADHLAEEKLPEGLRNAVSYFLVAAAAQGLNDPQYRFRAQNFLCHTSTRKGDHQQAADRIKGLLKETYDAIRSGKSGTTDIDLERGRHELARSYDDVPPLPQILEYIKKRLVDREIKIVNSEQDDAEFGPKLNFIVGGNILGRGLTIENLLVTYYLRSAKVAQMDTMLQHARMFGYRSSSAPFMRVYMPQLQAVRFNRIHQSERALREYLDEHGGGAATVPVQIAKDLRAARTGVLDPTRVMAYMPGEHLYPTAPLYTAADAARRHREAKERVGNLFPSGRFEELDRKGTLPTITFDQLIEALQYLPFEPLPGETWVPDDMAAVLRSARKIYGDTAYLYARYAQRTSLTEGMVGGDELKTLRSLGKPVLCVFIDSQTNPKKKLTLSLSGKSQQVDFEYVFPELIFPKTENMPAHIFNSGQES